ncbi:MAG: hypothetical protein JXR97_15030 [Planctomycetes bacterium]|nr:hypothetical protein [Planctomycetota bacterium]
MTTAAINKIDQQLDSLDRESLRAQVLVALRQFRSGWVELGRLLTEVAYGGDYKEWGYDDFEVYCARELGLKKPTVKKLMVSYNYMKSYEPNRLQKYEEAEDNFSAPAMPDYQTVELLHRARETGEMNETEAAKLHEMAFSGEEDEGFLRKEIRERIKNEGDEDVNDMGYQRKKELNDILRTARILRRKLAHSNVVPGGMKDRLEQLLVELEALD